MRNLMEISIQDMIVHILDGKPGGTTIFSDMPIDLAQSSVLTEYFQNQIIKVSQDGAARLARLVDEYAPDMHPLYQQIVTQPAEFVSESKKLGKRLHKIMVEDQRIVAGDLIICVVAAASYPDAHLLALLKLNPTHAIVHRSRKDKKGRWIVTLEAIADALPTAGERLQKAAIVRQTGDTEWELLVLDRQVGDPAMRPAADFFLRRFLGADWKLTAQAQTTRTFGAIAGVATNLYKRKDPACWTEAANIFQHLDVALGADQIDLDNVVQSMDVKEETKQAIQKELNKVLVQREIEVDRTMADKLTGKVRYRGEDDLVLSASSDVYKRLVTESEGPPYRIVIQTRRWQRLKPRR